MRNKKLDQLILELETHVECWKQFNHYLSLARSKNFTPEDENQFLEIKSNIAQGLQMLMSQIEGGGAPPARRGSGPAHQRTLHPLHERTGGQLPARP